MQQPNLPAISQALTTLGQQTPLLANLTTQHQDLNQLLSGQAALSADVTALSAGLRALSADVRALSADVTAKNNAIMQTMAENHNTLLQRLTYLDHASAIRAVNSSQAYDGPLQAIVRQDQPLPSNFPATPAELRALNAQTVSTFVDYYGIAAEGGVAARRTILGRYLGVSA